MKDEEKKNLNEEENQVKKAEQETEELLNAEAENVEGGINIDNDSSLCSFVSCQSNT